MILDLATLPEDRDFDCDVCVVGSGAAGLALANELIDTRLRVVLLEGGGAVQESDSQELYRSEVTGLPFVGVHEGRFRTLGGSTTRWGGQALPLMPIDFEPRDWVAHSGWPLRYGDLVPYYQRAHDFLGTDRLNFTTDLLELLHTRPPAFDEATLQYHFSKWSPTPDLRTVYTEPIGRARNLTLLLHANLTGIELEEGLGRVRLVEARTLGGRVARVRPRALVIACGGIESARILLANREQMTCGIGNGRDLVGRFFQDHPAAPIGTLRTDRPDRVQRLFNLFHHRGRKYSVRLTASPELQRRERMLNASAGVMFDVGADDTYELLRRAYHLVRRREVGRELMVTLARCAAHAPALARPVFAYYARSRTYTPNATFRVVINMEQEPDPGSRVTLSADRDALGVPRSEIRWSLTEASRRTAVTFSAVMREQLRTANVGELELEDWLCAEDADWRTRLSDQNHHIGTTRMHESPAHGVVDPQLRVHGVANLYVASSSVFPTGGHSNPTLTLLALCMRLADRLHAEL